MSNVARNNAGIQRATLHAMCDCVRPEDLETAIARLQDLADKPIFAETFAATKADDLPDNRCAAPDWTM